MRNDKIQITATYKVNYSDTLLEFLLKVLPFANLATKETFSKAQLFRELALAPTSLGLF